MQRARRGEGIGRAISVPGNALLLRGFLCFEAGQRVKVWSVDFDPAALEDLGCREASSGGSTEISGNLKSLAFADLIPFSQAAAKTGVLAIESGPATAEIHFDHGEVRHALTGDKEGEQAFC